MAPVLWVLFLINLVFIEGSTKIENLSYSLVNVTHLDIYANAISRSHYNPWTCNYRFEPGYKCISCTAALHCYPANLALLVQCAGFLPFCRNGYCSRWKSSDCNENYMFAEGTHGPFRLTTVANNKTTTLAENVLTTEITIADETSPTANVTVELINEVDETESATDIAGTDKPYVEKELRIN